MPRFVEPQLSHNLDLVQRFRAIAQDVGCTPAQLALAWTLHQGQHIVPIPGTRRISHLEQNIATPRLQLEGGIQARLEAVFSDRAIRGARYSAAAQRQIDTELLPGEELA